MAFLAETGEGGVFLIDFYVVPWAMLLFILLFFWAPAWQVAVALAVWRIVDILDYRLCVLLIDGEVEGWKSFSPTRSALAFYLNLFEIVTAYAILYFNLGHFANNHRVLATPLEAFYFSVVTMSTVGYGDFVRRTHIQELWSLDSWLQAYFSCWRSPLQYCLFLKNGSNQNQPAIPDQGRFRAQTRMPELPGLGGGGDPKVPAVS